MLCSCGVGLKSNQKVAFNICTTIEHMVLSAMTVTVVTHKVCGCVGLLKTPLRNFLVLGKPVSREKASGSISVWFPHVLSSVCDSLLGGSCVRLVAIAVVNTVTKIGVGRKAACHPMRPRNSQGSQGRHSKQGPGSRS